MIVVKTKMERIPETCKKCSIREPRYFEEVKGIEGICGAKHRMCPKERKQSGNVGYGMPKWCPLMDIDLIEEADDETD